MKIWLHPVNPVEGRRGALDHLRAFVEALRKGNPDEDVRLASRYACAGKIPYYAFARRTLLRQKALAHALDFFEACDEFRGPVREALVAVAIEDLYEVPLGPDPRDGGAQAVVAGVGTL